MSGYLSALVTVLSVGMLGAELTRQSPASSPPLPVELVYETFCQKEEPVRKKLFRSATVEQKSVLTRRQIERWREANLSRLSKTQLTALQELWTMATPAMFEPTDAGREAMESFERRADAAFSGREMDELGPYGPCIAKGEIAQALAAYAAGDASAIARWLDTPRGMSVLANAAVPVAGSAAVPAPTRLAFLLDLGMTVPAPFVPPLLRAGRALVADAGAVDERVERLWHQAARIHLNPRLPLARSIAAAGLCCWERVPGAAIQHGRAVQGRFTLDAALVLFEQAADDPALAAEARIRGAVLLQSAGRSHLPTDDGEHVRTFDRADGRFVRGPAPGWHDVTVTVKERRYSVRAKRGYWAGEPGSR